MDNPIRVLLADDHPLVRAGIRTVLAADPRVVLVGEASGGDDVPHLGRVLRPDVVLLDLNMPGPSPIQTVEALRVCCPAIKVIVLTAHDDDAYIQSMLNVGVAGYVLKDEAAEAVVQAILAVMQGGAWYSRPVLDKLLHHAPHGSTLVNTDSLTEREREVLRLLAQGLSNQEISNTLQIHVKTVEKHIANIFSKLGVASRVEAAAWAFRHALV